MQLELGRKNINHAIKLLLLMAMFLSVATPSFCDTADDYFDSGFAKQTKGDFDSAIADYTKAIELKPDFAAAFDKRGNAKSDKGDLDGALADYTKAIELKPDFAGAYNNRSNAKQANGDLAGAIADCSKAIELKPDYALAYCNRGIVEEAKGDLGGALADYNKAIELKPDLTEACVRRDHISKAKNASDIRPSDFNKANNPQPLNPASNTAPLVSMAPGLQERDVRPGPDLKTATNDNSPVTAEDWCKQGARFYDSGQYDKAIQCYDKAIEIAKLATNAIDLDREIPTSDQPELRPELVGPRPDLNTPTNPAPAVALSPDLQQIVKLAQTHLSDQIIVSFIHQSGKSYNPSTDGIISLNSQGVSQEVIKALLESKSAGNLSIAPAGMAPMPPQANQRWTNSLGMKFVPVPGTGVLFCVWLTRVRDYRAYARANGGVEGSWENPEYQGQKVTPTEDCPVVNVSWNDAEAFCRWLTDKERVEAKLGPRQGYRLPQDWEWSVAVGLNEPRGGTPKDKSEWSIAQNPGVYPWGTRWPPPRGAGNYADAAAKKAFSELTVIEGYDDGYATTSPVGSFAANRYGIYDLSGNVWEWCEDQFDSGETSRVARGASWLTGDPVSLSSAYCGGFEPGVRDGVIGFRCVLAGGATR